MTDTITIPAAEYEQLRRRAACQHCLPGCGHAEHYFVVEVQVGPVTERSIELDSPLSQFADALMSVAVAMRDDADVSCILLSGDALGLDDDAPVYAVLDDIDVRRLIVYVQKYLLYHDRLVSRGDEDPIHDEIVQAVNGYREQMRRSLDALAPARAS